MKGENVKIIYFRESAFQSAISDCVTFGIPALLAYLNYVYLGNSTWYQCAIVVIFFLSSSARSSKKVKQFHSYEELLKYLQEQSTPPVALGEGKQ